MNLQRIRQFAYLVPAVFSASVFGAVGVNKSFSPNSVVAGQSSTLTIVVLNPNASAATAVALTDTLPAGVVVANPLTVATNTCGFTVGATAGTRPIALSGGTIPAISGGVPGQCQVTVDVVSAASSTYLNTIAANAVSSSQGSNAQDAQATLVVSKPANITGGKVFAPTNVHGNGTGSTLTITLTNPNPIALTNATLTDSLPTAITIAGTPNAGTTCGAGTATPSPSASNPATIALSAGTIPASGSCTMTVDVVARNPNAPTNGNQANTIAAGALTTTQGATNPAISANINVQTGGQVTKAFAPTPIAPNGASNLTITVTNFDSTALSPITFTDTLPATITATALPVSSCGGTITTVPAQPALPPYTAFTLTAGSLGGVVGPGAGSTTCTVTIPVTATATGANSIPANNYGGVAIAAASGTLSISAITGSKAFTTPALQTGSTTMTITLNNLTALAATITSLRDDLTTMGAGFTVQSGATPGGTCGVTLTSPTPGTLITATGGTIPANGSCTIVLPLDIAATSATNNRTDTIAVANNATNGVHTSAGTNTITITGVVNVQRALTVTKAFSPATVQGGTPSRLTVTLTPTVALTGAGFVDDLTTLGAGFALLATGAGPNPVATNCGGGTITATPGATSFSLAGATLAAGVACTVAVNVATPVSTGTFTNRIVAANITTAQGVTTSDVTANLVLASTSVTVNKSFSPTTVAVGAPNFSTLSIQIRNNNTGAIALTGVGLTDVFPTGMAIFTTPSASFTGAGCSGATITAPAGATQISMSGASVNANSICTLSVRVVANIAGNLIDTVPAAVVVSTQGVMNPLQGTATLAATGTVNLTISKTDGVTTVIPGGTTTYTISLSNAGPDDVTGLGVNDTPPAGMSFGSWTCTATAGSACPASGSGPIAASVTVLHAGSVTFTVAAAIAAGATGSITNTVSLGVPGSVIDTNPVTSASDTDTLTPQADLSIGKDDGVAGAVPGTPVTYTIVANNNGPSDAPGATVTDTLPATITGATWTCAASVGSSCPASGSGNINASVNLLAGGSATFVLTGTIATTATGTLANTAVVTTPPGVTDTNPSNNSATDTDTLTSQADLAISKTDGVTSVAAGGATIYTIVAGNNGPSAVTGATMADSAPPGLSLGSWSCSATAGSSCPASGSGNISAALNLLVGGSATFTVNATVSGAATGTIANTATIAVPIGVSDPIPGNNAATDTDTITPLADLSITKTDGVAGATPGTSTTYTIVVRNNGPSSVVGAAVRDALPAAVTGATFTAIGSGGAAGFSASGSGDIDDTVDLPANAMVTYTVIADIAPDASGTLVNTATVTSPVGVPDPSPANNSATDTDTLVPQVTLAVVKTDGSASYTPGGTATYTVTVTDTGPSDAEDVTVSDLLPAGVTLTASASCVANGVAACGAVTGSIGQTGFGTTGAQIGAGTGNSLVFTVPVAFAANMAANPLVNTATASDVATGATASGVDSDALAPQVTLAVVKTDGSSTYTPGGSANYTVTITDAGLSDATNVTVADPLPTGVALAADATCIANGSASCGSVSGASGQTSFGATGASIAAGAGNALVFTAPVNFAPGMTADPLDNTATAADVLSGASGAATDSDALARQVSLAVTKSDGSMTYTPGGAANYTITVANTGLSDAVDVTVSDLLPAGVTLSSNATCVPGGSANCGTLAGSAGQSSFGATGASIAAGAGNLLVFTAPVNFASDLADDPLINAATAADLASGASGSGLDSDARAAQGTLGVTKSDGSTTYTPGGTATYTIVVSNAGPSDAFSTSISDPLPAGVSLAADAICVAAGAASCGTVTGTAGQTSFGATGAQLAAGAGNALTFTAQVAFAPTLATNPLVNIVTATDPALGPPATAVDSDTLTAVVDLAVTKTDGVSTAVPGQAVIYTIVVSNAGPSDALGATVSDTLPAAISSATWTCVASGGNCSASGSGSIGDTVNVPAGATLTYTLLASIASGASGNLVNTATVAAPAGATDSNPGNNSATDTDSLVPTADLAIAKTDGSASYTPGAAVTYTVVVGNAGPSGVTGATVADSLPAAITGATWTCTGVGGGSCPASGTGSINALVNLPAGGSVTFVLNGTVAPTTTGNLTNTATVTPPAGVTDPNPTNNSATDSDAPAGRVTLLLTKTDGRATYTPGGSATYTITVTNAGPSNATAVTVTDSLPAGVVLNGNASCTPHGTAGCGAISGAAGATLFSATGATIAAGAGDSLTITLPVKFSSVVRPAQLVNTVTATDPDSPSVASASDSDKLSGVPAAAIPADARWALALLVIVLLYLAWRTLGRVSPRVTRK
ncbi:MAG TPA: hypothetical protein VIH15_14160 [Casimicrobiaceae bacterium]